MKPVPIFSAIRYAVIAITISLLGCASRYRLELDVIEAGEKRRVQVEETQFARGAVLGDPMSDSEIQPGDGNCVIATVGARMRSSESRGKYEVFSYDEHLQYRLFLQLPAKLTAGELQLAGNSFVQAMGRYELGRAEKIFSQGSGKLTVDSLAHSRAFFTIDGRYLNQSGTALEVKGEFKVKVK